LIGLDGIGRCMATLRRPWQVRSDTLPRFDGVLDRLENLDVGPAAADVAVEVAANLLSGWLGVRLQERLAGQQHPRGTEAALGCSASDEGLLEWVQTALRRQTLDRHDRLSGSLEGQIRAGADGFAVDQDSAGPADLGLARPLRPGEAEPLAHQLQQGLLDADVAPPRLAVDLEGNRQCVPRVWHRRLRVHGVGHLTSSRWHPRPRPVPAPG